jgi:hypothetical protein
MTHDAIAKIHYSLLRLNFTTPFGINTSINNVGFAKRDMGCIAGNL